MEENILFYVISSLIGICLAAWIFSIFLRTGNILDEMKQQTKLLNDIAVKLHSERSDA